MAMEQVIKYFNGERAESILFLLAGVITVLAGLYFMFYLKSSFWKGAAIPLLLVASLELVVGYVIYNRSPKDVDRVKTYMEQDPSKIRSIEIPRMEQVLRNFTIFRYIELSLILMGFALMYYTTPNSFWQGLGLGLFSQCALVLLMDFFAESRGIKYLEFLKGLETSVML